MVKKSIVVLANSYKPGGRCVAGKVVKLKKNGKWKLTNTWIRPVSSNAANHGSITSRYHIVEKRDIRLLDIVAIEFEEPSPDSGQPENWLIDEATKWTYEGRFNQSICSRLTDEPPDLWIDSNYGVKIHEVGAAYENAGNIQNSLAFIKPDNFNLHLSNDHSPWTGRYKKESKVTFSYNGDNYSGISMTDPVFRNAVAGQYPEPDGEHVVATLPKGNDYHICISLSPIFEKTQKHYKLVAAVI